MSENIIITIIDISSYRPLVNTINYFACGQTVESSLRLPLTDDVTINADSCCSQVTLTGDVTIDTDRCCNLSTVAA